jgi:hypothetical protein
LIGAETGIKTIAAVLMGHSRRRQPRQSTHALPLLPRKLT